MSDQAAPLITDAEFEVVYDPRPLVAWQRHVRVRARLEKVVFWVLAIPLYVGLALLARWAYPHVFSFSGIVLDRLGLPR